MSFTCEISGEPLATTTEEVVVTPSGHTCIKRVLLAKLAENGGMDPFEQMRERPLSEDQLITLRMAAIVPPRTQATSLPNLLKQMQSEYDALVLELFDTRKALEDTRRELSQALYQNDAAVRVVARLSMERDAARQELEKWNASVGPAPPKAQPEASEEDVVEPEEPSKKRRRTEAPTEPLKNSIPDEDLQAMVDTWGKLQPTRKPMLKEAAASAPSPEDLAAYTSVDKKAYHKSTCKGLTAMATSGDLIATAGRDKQVVVYSSSEKVVKHSFNFGTIPNCVDILESSMVVASNAGGRVIAYSLEDGSTLGEYKTQEAIVDVRIHPTSNHICITNKSGKVIVCLVEGKAIHSIAEFSADESDLQYSSGALHPDGLIYVAGSESGAIHLWDFKNKNLAGTLQEGEGDAVKSIVFSSNGYHLAVAYASGTVRCWDLRKQKTIATLNSDNSLLDSVSSLAFDASGKYMAYGGSGGVQITTVKEWGTTVGISSKSPISGLAWGENSILVACCEKERDVHFFGKPSA